MKTIRPILATPACVFSILFVAMSATGELRAQAETTPETKPQTPTETKPAAEAETKPEAAPAPQSPEMDAMVNDIKKHAELCSEANLKMDFERIVQYMPKKLLELAGGREALKTMLTQGNAELKKRGVTIDASTIGKPQAPQKYAGVLVSLVPMTTNLTTPQGKLIATSHMIAISEDNGKSWAFADTATVNEEKLGMLYPALKGKVKIPPATAQAVK